MSACDPRCGLEGPHRLCALQPTPAMIEFAFEVHLDPRTGTSTLNSVSTDDAAVVDRMITALQEARSQMTPPLSHS